MKVIVALFLISILSSCAFLNSVTVTSIPKNRSTKVTSERKKFIFLFLNFNNDFVNEMEKELAQKCDGKIQGIITKTESIVYFPILFNAYKVTAEGYCVQ